MPLNYKLYEALRIAKIALQLPDAEYIAVIREHGGANNAIFLDEAGFQRVMDHFQIMGLTKVDYRQSRKTLRMSLRSEKPMASKGMILHIRRRWCEAMAEDDAGFDRYLSRAFRGQNLDHLTLAAARQIEKLIARQEARGARDVAQMASDA